MACQFINGLADPPIAEPFLGWELEQEQNFLGWELEPEQNFLSWELEPEENFFEQGDGARARG